MLVRDLGVSAAARDFKVPVSGCGVVLRSQSEHVSNSPLTPTGSWPGQISPWQLSRGSVRAFAVPREARCQPNLPLNCSVRVL